MTDSENDETYEYKNRPEENEIFEDLEIKLREIDGWYNLRKNGLTIFLNTFVITTCNKVLIAY